MPRVVGLPRLQALYRRFVGMDLDKSKAAFVLEVAEETLRRLFEAGVERAAAEGRSVVEWRDLPVTRGLAETMERYEAERARLGDPRLDLSPILGFLAGALGGMEVSGEVRERLPGLAATALLLVGYVARTVDPGARRPGRDDLERARRILRLTL